MPAIRLGRHTQPSIGEMRDRVWVCTTTERPDDWVSTIVERPGVFRCHARVRDTRPDQIINYQAVFGTEDSPTKEITIRCPPDVKVDLNHWVYQEVGRFTKVWYKIRSVEDLGQVNRFLILQCSIDTVNDKRNDPATQEPPPVWQTPDMD